MIEPGQDSPKAIAVERTVDMLNQALQKIQENDYVSAQVMAGIAKHLLEQVQSEIEAHLSMERMLRKTLRGFKV